jgi:hypothetical protein
MKKQVIALVLGISTVCSNSALSYYKDKEKDQSPVKKYSVGIEKAAGCAPASKGLYMEFNDVKAWVENGGSMFLNRQAGIAAYEIPKSGPGEVKHFAIYAGALWMGGTDVNGQLKLAALRYRKGNDFWSGPLSVNSGSGNFKYDFSAPQGDGVTKDFGAGTITPDQCLAYDKFYTIGKSEVIAFSTWWESENIPVAGADPVEKPSNDVMNRIENWPAHGDISLGQDYYLAPFYDRDNNGNYNPLTEGDYPWYDDILNRDDVKCGADRRVSLYGDQTFWWVFNDKGGIHTETGGEPIGMEIRAQAFAFSTDDEINRMTFYNYELINRGTQTLKNTYFSQFLDADLGNPQDDYTGCDVSRGLGYVYNGDTEDETNQQVGYGFNPPAVGVDFFEGPYKDADKKDNGYYPTDLNAAIADSGIVYPGIGIGYGDNIIDNERFGMTRFTYFTGQGAVYPYTDPDNAVEYYNFMQGKWANGSDLTYGGQGHGGSVLSAYMFPDDSDPLGWATGGPQANWNEQTAGNAKGDRRFVQSAGSFTLRPGAVNNITVGIVYGRGLDGDLFSSVRALKRADTKAQALFNVCFKIFDPPMAPKLTVQELNNEIIIMLDNPSISHNNYQEKYKEKDEVNITDPSYDQYYRFEGYQIFQLVNSSASVSDILDPTKAQLVAQCDKKNGISRLINFEYDESLGFSIPSEKVKGEDKGIKHSFKINEDFFAYGNRALVNNKTYYYIAIAYAYNNYKTYNPSDALLLDGQKKTYVSSRLGFDGNAIKSVSAIPHNPITELDGTEQMAEYGTTPEITRIDGYGNGNRALELTNESKDYIIKNGFMQEPTYEKGSGPINIKVVDPLNIADGYFECLYDGNGYDLNGTNGTDKANWTINRYDYKGGTLLDSKSSTINISQDNEQVIPQWGISVQIYQNKYTGTGLNLYTSPISSSIDFADSSKRWLSFIPDADGFTPQNWIRAGISKDTSKVGNPAYLKPSCYNDEIGIDPDKLYTKILNGGVAPHRLVGYQCDFMPLAYYGLASGANAGSLKTYAQIAFTPSVDIVLTSDKSKWTRCPVFELGRDINLTIGGAKSGGLRKSASVGKDGLPDNSDTTTGMGWFPGYAIDIESGARLFMAFGENSFLGIDNGSDMIWNPTSRLNDNSNNPILGGQHPIYVYSYKNATINGTTSAYDFPSYNKEKNEVYKLMKLVESGNVSAKNQLYGSLTWILNSFLTPNKTLLSTEVSIKLRVNKEFKSLTATGRNAGKPMYSWNMNELATRTNSKSQLAEALKLINIVPNPYYAYSQYETGRLDTRVKITNLPEKCNVSIYSVNGKLIRAYKKDSQTSYLDWDLNNHKGIPVAGGVYLIHVDIPDVGERVLKFFGGMRQVDLQSL